jgi:DNA mismatch repair protein MutS
MKQKVTPLMEQYLAIQKQHPDALLFFQVGDFFELFFEHARIASHILGIALTKRGTHEGKPIPLCGVPLHALDHHLIKLIKAGHHVAICEQLEEAKPGTVVKRGVTHVLTPGTLTDTKLLDEKRASFLCSCFIEHDAIALVCAELLTGQLHATLIKPDDHRSLEAQLYRFMPDEIIVGGQHAKKYHSLLTQQGFTLSNPVNDDSYPYETWLNTFTNQQFSVIKKSPAMYAAFAQIHAYLSKNQAEALHQLRSCMFYRTHDFLALDAATQRNLEIVRNTHDGTTNHTLLSIFDRAVTAMGSRTIKKWLLSPLVHKAHIEHRLDAVETFVRNVGFTQAMTEIIQEIGDLERIVGRIALKRAQLHDYIKLTHALALAPTIRTQLDTCHNSALLQKIHDSITSFLPLHQLLESSLHDVHSSGQNEHLHASTWIIKKGFDHALDELRTIVLHTHDNVIALEMREKKETGISSLKVGYNHVHGYYIEITQANIHLVPQHYTRRQTLVNKERFTTPELIELEHKLAHARAEIDTLEQQAYERVKQAVYEKIHDIRTYAYALAHLDAYIGLALAAYENGYTRPTIHEGRDIIIKDGRHPVVSQTLGSGFIANDTHLTNEQRFWLLTGPNMGGKSTYLRQVAHICLLAHCGSFVPAAHASIPILDRIFTRVGAGDNLAEGKSTFLIEMEETATICLQATEKSLVILDEVGRGTSTYDGLAIAQAVVEYLYHTINARCLFATHYHELTQLESTLPGVTNVHTASTQRPTGVIFLHKIVPGAAAGSFGLEVAKLAKLPPSLVERAEKILYELTTHRPHSTTPHEQSVVPAHTTQHHPNVLEKYITEELATIDMNDISPRQAYELLWNIQKAVQKHSEQ